MTTTTDATAPAPANEAGSLLDYDAGQALELMLAEYANLKDEQRQRIAARNQLPYLTIGAIAGVLAATFTAHQGALLLLLPPVTIILGWNYLVGDERVTALGRYIGDALAPAMADLAGHTAPPLFGWETIHRSDPRRDARKVGWLAVDLLTFAVTPAAAIIAASASANVGVVLAVVVGLVALAEAIGVGLLTARIIRWSDVTIDMVRPHR
jgi:hypothetical protein